MQTGPFSYQCRTEIESLYLCGASTTSHGVAGAAHTGIVAAAAILGCKPDDLLKPEGNQNVSIYDAEDSSTWPESVLRKIKKRKRRFKEMVVGVKALHEVMVD